MAEPRAPAAAPFPLGAWGWPLKSRKAHFFVEGRSLCRSWLYLGQGTKTQSTSAERPGPDDCTACWRRLHRQERRRA